MTTGKKFNWDRFYGRLQRACRSIVNNKYFGISVFTLILISVIFILIELAFVPPKPEIWVHKINNYIILIFLVELSIRFIAVGSLKSFFKEYWIDVVAILPFLPFLRFLRVVRLLRLLRMVSLFVFMRRHMRAFIYFFQKRIVEYMIIFAVIAFIVVFATITLVHFEGDGKIGAMDILQKKFWIAVYSMFAGEYITDFPQTIQGKIILLMVMFSGMGLFAILTGTVSAIMIERLKEGAILGKLNFKDMEEHIIICGWNDHVPKIIAEFQGDPDYRGRNFVVISEIEELPDMSSFGVDMTSVYLVKKDFISAETLKFANIEEAAVAIILADTHNKRTDYDADARTVLAALTIEKLNPKIYSCAELVHPENESHLKMSGIESIVLSSNISAYMMTQASMKASVVPFYTELLRPSQGNQIYEVPFPDDHVGKLFSEVMNLWKQNYDSLLVGVIKTAQNRHVSINPIDYTIQENDWAIVISRKKPRTKVD